MSLKLRTSTALIFGVIMIGGTLLTPESSAVLYALIGLLCLWEFFGLVLIQDSKAIWNKIRKLLAITISMTPTLLTLDAMWSPAPIIKSGYLHWCFPLIMLPFLVELLAKSTKPFQNIAFNILALLYLGLPTALLGAISLQHFTGRFIIMAIVLLIWANDVFAYFTGKWMGKRKIFPDISPNKTLEGTIGGFISALLWGVVSYFMWFVVEYQLWQWLVLAALSSVFGVIGDLVVSMLKRSLNIKDTGNTLPGHGGLLDRFDAFIFAVPFIVFTIVFVLNDNRFVIGW